MLSECNASFGRRRRALAQRARQVRAGLPGCADKKSRQRLQGALNQGKGGDFMVGAGAFAAAHAAMGVAARLRMRCQRLRPVALRRSMTVTVTRSLRMLVRLMHMRDERLRTLRVRAPVTRTRNMKMKTEDVTRLQREQHEQHSAGGRYTYAAHAVSHVVVQVPASKKRPGCAVVNCVRRPEWRRRSGRRVRPRTKMR